MLLGVAMLLRVAIVTKYLTFERCHGDVCDKSVQFMDRLLVFISSPCKSDSNPVGDVPRVEWGGMGGGGGGGGHAKRVKGTVPLCQQLRPNSMGTCTPILPHTSLAVYLTTVQTKLVTNRVTQQESHHTSSHAFKLSGQECNKSIFHTVCYNGTLASWTPSATHITGYTLTRSTVQTLV